VIILKKKEINMKGKDDLDKLLELASAKPKVQEKKPQSNPEIDKFIQELNILAGKKKVPTYVVYYSYYLWKKTRLIPRRKFINYFKTKFEKIKTDDGIGFLLNAKSFDLTPQGFFKARALLRKEQHEQKKAKS